MTSLHKSGAQTSIFNTPTITNTHGVQISIPEPLERIIPLSIGSFLQSVRVSGNSGEQVHNFFPWFRMYLFINFFQQGF